MYEGWRRSGDEGAAKRIVAMSAKEEKEQSARSDEGVAKGKGRERKEKERDCERAGRRGGKVETGKRIQRKPRFQDVRFQEI